MESLLYDSSDLTRYYKSSRLATTRNNNFFFQIQISWCNCEGKGIARCPWLPDLYTGWLPRYRVSCNVHYKALIMRHRCDSLWPPWTRLLQLQQWRPSSRLAFSLQTFHLVVNLISTVCVCVCVCAHVCIHAHVVFTQTFRDAGTSDYIVCYLRIVTSGYLQTNAEFFQAFVDEGKTIKEYCSEVSSVPQERVILPAGY